jgi:hypothetical protein
MTFAGPVPGVPGATVRDAPDLPEHLPDAQRIDPWTEMAPGSVLLTVPGIARFLIQNGSTIGVEPSPDAARGAVELFLHGPVRGTLIHQRGELPLEATTLVSPRGGAIALCGLSATGKSTLAAELCRRGWSLVADDVTRTTLTRGRALVWPCQSALKLWRDACARLGINTDELRPTREGMAKYYVDVAPARAPAPLQAIVRIQRGKSLELAEPPPEKRAAVIAECVFKRRQVDALNVEVEYNEIVRGIASTCRVLLLNGAREFPSAMLADRIARATT